MDMTLSGMVYSPCLPLGQQTRTDWSLLKRTPSSEEKIVLVGSTVIEVRAVQLAKAK